MRRILDSDLIVKVLAALLIIAVLAGILGLTFWVRHSAPCWVFPLAEAPTRCLPGATQ